MIAMLAVVLALQVAPATDETPWTWSLYSDQGGPLVLAREVPDTAELSATFECDRGTSVSRVTLYGGGPAAGMATARAGEASAMTEAETVRGGGVRLALRVDHPVFAAFADGGDMAISIGEQRRSLDVPAAHLAKLRQFAELCSG